MNFSKWIVELLPPREEAVTARGSTSQYIVRQAGQDAMYSCLLCNVADMSVNDASQHCQSYDHTRQRDNLAREKERCVALIDRYNRLLSTSPPPTGWWDNGGTDSSSILERVERLRASQQEELHAAMFRYIIANPAVQSPYVRGRMLQTEIVDKLYKFEQENVELLVALATWKALCQLEMPPVVNYHAAEQWLREGWKSRKNENRHANEISIVVTAIRPFL